MELNKKIAERRAELQRVHAAEEEIRKKVQAAKEESRKKEEREQEELLQAEKRALEELSEKEAILKIQEIEDRLSGEKKCATNTEENQCAQVENEDYNFDEKQRRVSAKAEKKVAEHIKKLADKRITSGEKWTGRIIFIGVIAGFFYVWWLGLGLLILGGWYADNVTNRHKAKIKLELGRK